MRSSRDLLDAIEQGIGGEYYTSAVKGKRWVGPLVTQRLGVNEARAKALVKDWLCRGVLKRGKYNSPERDRHECERLVVLEAGRENLLTQIGGVA
jgi:hypothetical protein